MYHKTSNKTQGIDVFQLFEWAKKFVFSNFNVIKQYKMRVLLEIRVLLECEPCRKYYGNQVQILLDVVTFQIFQKQDVYFLY